MSNATDVQSYFNDILTELQSYISEIITKEIKYGKIVIFSYIF